MRHLHRLHLIAGDRREGEAEREIGRDEQAECKHEERQRAAHRHVEDESRDGRLITRDLQQTWPTPDMRGGSWRS